MTATRQHAMSVETHLSAQHKNRALRPNKLNELSGKEWIKFTKSWFVHRPEPRGDRKVRHPAPFPESLVRDFILFFTKRNQLIVDPFLGTGSTLVAAVEAERSGVGFEIAEKYSEMSRARIAEALDARRNITTSAQKSVPLAEVVTADSNRLSEIWRKNGYPPADYCITSPPYWNQLKRNSIRQKQRKARGLDTEYSNDPEDLGNIEHYPEFLTAIKHVFDEVYKIMRPKGYLTIITNNIFTSGRMYPLAFDMVSTLSQEPYAWTPKDEKVWCQDDKTLLPLGVYNAWVGNRHHQYCLIFRKEPAESTSARTF
ncbi:MAG TPA: DNA methyltransferase [Candidatus Dormibacteraeota bacterium]|nr:DNA methyltransferase [Candidatus Dormibacteraeota bacterium]